MGQYETRHPIGQRRLADALRAADQPCMRNAPAPVGAQQRRFGFVMPEQRTGFARMRRDDLGLGLAWAHAVLATLAADVAKKRSRSAVQTKPATVLASAEASISTQRFGSAAAISR